MIAAFSAAMEMASIARLIKEMHFTVSHPMSLFSDYQSTIQMVNNPGGTTKSKHSEVRVLKLKEFIKLGYVDLKYVPTQKNPAEIFTKSHNGNKTKSINKLINLK